MARILQEGSAAPMPERFGAARLTDLQVRARAMNSSTSSFLPGLPTALIKEYL